jgi:hypothetical protein
VHTRKVPQRLDKLRLFSYTYIAFLDNINHLIIYRELNIMNRLLLVVAVLAMIALISSPSNAKGKMMLGVGADVLIPTGDFGDAQSTGFGGSARFQYNVTPLFSAGLMAGYFTWSGKDSGPDFKGLPVRVFGKYYFMPTGEKARVYGIAELGSFFSSADVPQTTIGSITVSGGSVSSTDFSYAPGIGVEIALGSGNSSLDISARYDGIATTGSSAASIGGRVGVNFGLGK